MLNKSNRFHLNDITRVGIIALAYFLAHKISFLFPDSKQVLMALWPAAGVGLSALLLSQKKLWPAILLALFVAGNTANFLDNRPLISSVGFMTANIIESFGSALIITQWCGQKISFTRIKEVLALILAATLINAVSALIGAETASITHPGFFWSFWKTWVISDGLGILLVAPLIISWSNRPGPLGSIRWYRLLEVGVFFAVWCISSWLLFSTKTDHSFIVIQPYMLFALLAWNAFRFGQRGVTVALVLLACIAVNSNAIITGPLIWGGDTVPDRLLYLQLYVGFAAVTGFLLTASYAELKQSEIQKTTAFKALEENNERFSLFMRFSPIYTYIKEVNSTESRVLQASDNFTEMIGIPGTRMINKTMDELFPPEFAAKITADDQAVVAKDEVVYLEETLNNRYYSTIKFPIRQGQRTFLAGYTIDITERKLAETAKEESAKVTSELLEKLNEAQSLARIGSWEWNLLNNEVWWSDEVYRIFDLYREEYVPSFEGNSRFIHPDDLVKYGESFERSLKTGDALELDIRVVTKAGLMKYCYAKGTIVTDQSGKQLRFVGTIMDISERKIAEEALKKNETLLNEALKIADLGIWEYDVALSRFTFNDQFYSLFHATAEMEGGYNQSLESYAEKFVHPDDSAKVAVETQKALETADPDYHSRVDHRIICTDGEIRHIAVHIRVKKDSRGRTIKTYGVNQDITERKLSEEMLLNSLREKETLLQELYHRTKNTMQVIRGMIVLQAAEFPANIELQKVVSNTEDRIQAISLVHQMLYQARDLSRISIKEYIYELSDLIFKSFGVSKDRIALNLKIDKHHFLIDTAVPFGLIINELITNTLKYAFPDDNPGIISISLTYDENGKNVLQYSDNGIGVPDEFDFRNQNSLGLKLIYGIGEQQMLGKVIVENNNGVRCTIEFPDSLYSERV